MEKRKLNILGIGIILFFVLIGMSFPNTSMAATKTLHIGYLGQMTGWFSVHDIQDAKEIQIIADYINEKGGITVNGQRYNIEIEIEDGKSSFDGVSAAANKLAYDDKVKFVIGPNAFFSLAAGPIFNPAKVLYIEGFNTLQPGELDKTTPYAFTGYNGSLGQSYAVIKYLKQAWPAVKKVAFIHPDDGAISHSGKYFRKTLADNGLVMVGDIIAYANETTDFNPIATKLLSMDIDAVVHINGIAPHVGGIVRGLREAGNTEPYAAGVLESVESIRSIAGKTATMNLFTYAIMPGAKGNPPLMAEMVQRVVAKTGSNVAVYLQGANSLWILKEVIEAANSFDPSAVKDKWQTLDTVETLYGTGLMGGAETYGIANHALSHPQPMQIIREDGIIRFGGIVQPVRIP